MSVVRNPRARLAIGLLLAAAMVWAAMALPATLADAQEARSGTDELATLINRARVSRGIPPLARSAELDAAAAAQSQDMVQNRFLDHQGSDGSTPQQRAERAGYRVPANSGWIVVELISAISAEPSGPLNWWLNESPEIHGKVLLNPRWREMGVGYARGGEYGNYWTVLVGCRPAVLPAVTFEGQTFRHTEACVPGAAAQPTVAPSAAPSPASAAAPEVAGVRVPGLRLSVDAARGGGATTVSWDNLPYASAMDWIGLYQPGARDTDYVTWLYVSCAGVPSVPRPSGSCSVPLPYGRTGVYEVRLFAANGFARLNTTTTTVTVTDP